MRGLAFLFACAVLLVPFSAEADGQTPNGYLSLLGGYSASFDDPTLDPMRAALGARAGFIIPSTEVYLGGLFLFHFGESSTSGALGLASTDVSANSFMVGGEGGYEFRFDTLVLRPSFGLGMLAVSYSTDVSTLIGSAGSDNSSSDLFLSPGLALMYVGKFMVGGEFRYNGVPDSDIPDSLSMLASLGLVL